MSVQNITNSVAVVLSNSDCLSEILSYLDDPGSTATVCKTWRDFLHIAWLKKFEPLRLTNSDINTLKIPKAILYQLCTRCNFAFRRCIDEQGMKTAQKMASQAYTFLSSFCGGKISRNCFDLLEIASMESCLRKNTRWTHTGRRNSTAQKKEKLIKQFIGSVAKKQGEEKTQYIASWVASHIHQPAQMGLELGYCSPFNSNIYTQFKPDLLMPPLSLLSCIKPRCVIVEGDSFTCVSDAFSKVTSIERLVFLDTETKFFPPFEKMKRLTSVCFEFCNKVGRLPSSLKDCSHLTKIEIHNCEKMQKDPLPQELLDKYYLLPSYPFTAEPTDKQKFIMSHITDFFVHSEEITFLMNKGITVLIRI
jgi:hypothetical protein